MPYEKLPTGTADETEREVLDQWRSEDLFRQTLEATKEGAPFVFYEGPPTANGRPGIHHVFARTIKDLVCRYQTLKGRSVTRIAGWDTHGLPVEIEVEKALGISGKSDIERFGVAEFNRRCRESVFRYKADWESLSDRIGYWLDYDRPYVTYEKEYVESVWWLLHRLWTKGLLYEGQKVLPYCSRCGTSLSSHELAMGYQTHHRSPSIYVLFRLESDGDAARHLLVWTTTPWTLPSNVAIAVNPSFRYVEIDVNGIRVIVEESIAETTVVPGAAGGEPLGNFPVVATHEGSALIGERYEQLLDIVEVDSTRAFRVLGGDFVTKEEGTGLVHMAPAFGADDYDAVQREGMAFVNPVDEQGRFQGTKWDVINGSTVFEANAPIAERLQAEEKLFGRYEPKGYEHTYPFCWRCDAPLIYYARTSWFVRTTAFKDRMVAFNKEVNWSPPEVGTGRFGEWLESNVDWALSRDRFWGTPLPVWVCEGEGCDEQVVIGSYEELQRRWGRPLPDDFDPHKPYIDEVTFVCAECQGTMRRVTAVIDAWFDSGAMPYAQWHFPFENEADFEAHFPADYICEGLDQTRGWFYSLLAISAGVSEQPAYRNVIVNGLLLDADGRKMSKRVGNVIDPWEPIKQFGADAVRLYLLASSQVWLPKRFDPKAIPEVVLGFLNRLRNTYDFFALYADGASRSDAPPRENRDVLDRWLLSRLAGVVRSVDEAWAGFDVTAGTRALIEFADNDLSQWYVRMSRQRFWAPDSTADPSAVATLYDTLETLVRLLAPAAPFMSDAIHRRLTGKSVHLASFPEAGEAVDTVLEEAMAATRRLSSLARKAREGAGLRVRQPLAEMRVAVPHSVSGSDFDACLELLKREVNVKTISIVRSDTELVTLEGKPNFRTLGKVYGADTPAAAAAARELTVVQLQQLEAGNTVTLELGGRQFGFRPVDVVVERRVATDWLVESDGPFVAALNPMISEDLRREGLARELVNRVQRLRRDAGYHYTTRIALAVSGEDDALAAARAFDTFIAGETLARRFEVGEELNSPDVRQSVDLDGRNAVVTLKRFDGEDGA